MRCAVSGHVYGKQRAVGMLCVCLGYGWVGGGGGGGRGGKTQGVLSHFDWELFEYGCI
jgi:hypothetical protein